MGRKSREMMAAAKASLEAKKRQHGSLAGTQPCQAMSALAFGRCGTPTAKSVVWPGSGGPVPACSLRCAMALAGNEHFDDARWG